MNISDNEVENGNSNVPTEQMSVTQISYAIADNLASSKQHRIPVFSGNRDENPLKFVRVFLRVARALKWDDKTKVDKFPNHLSGAAEEWHYIKVECLTNSIDD